ncbi:MAG: hypothetical protein V4553_02270 [Bacteroidota bacterium]
MAADFKILGWSVTGLRCPDHDVSFEKSANEVHKISLLQMPNGTGKTTTLKLLRAALAGPEMWNNGSEQPINFRKDNSVTDGHFILRLLYNRTKRLTIEIHFDFNDNGKFTYYTTGPNGKDEGFHPPFDLKFILKPDFVKLLIFDGELAANLLSSSHTNAQNAIETMYQLYFFNRIKERIDEHWSKEANKVGSRGSAKEFTQRKNRVEALKKRVQLVNEKKNEDALSLDNAKKQVDQLETEFQKEIQKNQEDAFQLDLAKTRLANAEQDVSTLTMLTVTLMKNPPEFSLSFSDAILALKDNLDRVKLPGIAAREFFEEIADEDNCICGREIDDEVKEVIREGAQKYLGSEEVGVLNAMKSDIKERIVDLASEEQPLKLLIDQLEEAQQAEQLARQDLDTIKELASENDPNIRAIHTKISELKKTIGRLENEVLKYDNKTDDSDTGWNLENLERRKKQAEQDLAKVTDTIELKAKRDILCRILDSAYQTARESINEGVCNEANEKIKVLMPYNHIRISSINKSIKLADKEGGSVGETLSIGYAFLSTLLSNDTQHLPSVVDSPSGPVDLKIRPEIAKLIPRLGEQFIAFTISSEREGFIEPLIKASSEDINFLTLFRKEDITQDSSAKTVLGAKESNDGILVPGKIYFETFHKDNQ